MFMLLVRNIRMQSVLSISYNYLKHVAFCWFSVNTPVLFLKTHEGAAQVG